MIVCANTFRGCQRAWLIEDPNLKILILTNQLSFTKGEKKWTGTVCLAEVPRERSENKLHTSVESWLAGSKSSYSIVEAGLLALVCQAYHEV